MNQPRLKRLLQNLALSAASLLICVALLEVILRFCGYGNVEIYEPDPVLYWKLRPNQDCYTKIDRKPVHINSFGTRGPEFQPAKPPNTIRILCLGDSRTFGWGLSEGETYSGGLEQRLKRLVGSRKKIEVINAGVNAWSYAQMRVYFRDTAIRYKPDFVIIGGANLWTQFSDKNSPEFVKKFMSRVRLKNFLRRFALYHYVVETKLKEVYERYRTKFIPIDPEHDNLFKEQQQKDPDAFFRGEIEEISRLALTNGGKPLLLFLPTLNDLTNSAPDRDLRAKTYVSDLLKVDLLDLSPDLSKGGKLLYLDADPVHLNVAGNEIVAQRLFLNLTNGLSP